MTLILFGQIVKDVEDIEEKLAEIPATPRASSYLPGEIRRAEIIYEAGPQRQEVFTLLSARLLRIIAQTRSIQGPSIRVIIEADSAAPCVISPSSYECIVNKVLLHNTSTS